MEPYPGGKWDPGASRIFEEILEETLSLAVLEKNGEKYSVRLLDKRGGDVSTRITSLGRSIYKTFI